MLILYIIGKLGFEVLKLTVIVSRLFNSTKKKKMTFYFVLYEVSNLYIESVKYLYLLK